MNPLDNPLWIDLFANAVESLFSSLEAKKNITILVIANDTTIEDYLERFGPPFDPEHSFVIRSHGYRGTLWGATVRCENELKDGVVVVIGDNGDNLSINLKTLPFNLNIELK